MKRKGGRYENELQKINFQFVNSLSRLQLSLNRPLKYICIRSGRYLRQTPVLRTPGHRGNTYLLAPPPLLSRYRQEKLPVSYVLEDGKRFSVHAKLVDCVSPEEVYLENLRYICSILCRISVVYMPRIHVAR